MKRIGFESIIFVTQFIFLSVLAVRRQELTFYTNSNYTGSSETFYESESDIQSNSVIGKIAKSVCVSRGVWMISGLINGEATFDGWNSANLGELCSTWNIRNQTAIYLSIRRVSGSDVDSPSLSLYSQPNFRGTEFHVADPPSDFQMSNSSFEVASVAFTGRRHWDLFPEQDFAGEANCVEAQEFLGFPMDVSFYTHKQIAVGSLKIDCHRQEASRNNFTSSRELTISNTQPTEIADVLLQFDTLLGSHLLGNTQVRSNSRFYQGPDILYPSQNILSSPINHIL